MLDILSVKTALKALNSKCKLTLFAGIKRKYGAA